MKILTRKRIIILGMCCFCFPILLFEIYIFGLVFDFEYPYWRLLQTLKSSETILGKSAAEEISSVLGVDEDEIDWHRCGYCTNFDKDLPPGFIWVQIHVIPGQNYEFGYSIQSNLLKPATEEIKKKFPRLGPIVRK